MTLPTIHNARERDSIIFHFSLFFYSLARGDPMESVLPYIAMYPSVSLHPSVPSVCLSVSVRPSIPPIRRLSVPRACVRPRGAVYICGLFIYSCQISVFGIVFLFFLSVWTRPLLRMEFVIHLTLISFRCLRLLFLPSLPSPLLLFSYFLRPCLLNTSYLSILKRRSLAERLDLPA